MSRIHPDVEEAFEQIDAAVFSGDAFYEAENLDKLETYVGRWQRAIAARRVEIAEAEARRADVQDEDGPGEEDGPWAEGWEDRVGPYRADSGEGGAQ